jgi:NitT/TauT family transport system substrate-binding protein
MRGRVLIFAAALAVLLGAGCTASAAPTPEPVEVTVQLNWLHYATFGGLYAADQNGLYAGEGLTVQFVEGGTDVDYVAAVLRGDADFGVAGADELLEARAAGQPVRAIATILQRSPIVFVAPADSGITHPTDLVGKTVRVTPQIDTTLHAMLSNLDIPEDSYSELVLPSTLDAYSSGQADVWGVYYNSFAVTLREAGYELNTIFPDDYGVHFYADMLFTTDEFIAEHPDLVTRFLRATLEGYAFAIEQPDAIGPLVVQYDPDADAALESAKMAASVPLIHSGSAHIGWMEPRRWEAMRDKLVELGFLAESVPVDDVYTMTFLRQIYGDSP